MSKRTLVIGAVVALAALNVAAFCVDCVRLADAAAARVALGDSDMEKQEARLAKLLTSDANVSGATKEAVAAWQKAVSQEDRTARQAAYDKLVAAARSAVAPNPTDPLERKFADDVAGAINRRQVAEKPYEDEQAAYDAFLKTFRGRVAKWFAPPAR